MINFEKVLVYNVIIKLILICIYFLKSYIFRYLRMVGNFIISYILDYKFKPLKFFGFDSFQCKNIFLKLFTLGVLLRLIFTNKVNFILNNIFDIKVFIYLVFIIFCLFLGYRKVEKKRNFFVLPEMLFQLFMQDLFMHKKGIIYKENQYKYKIIYKIMPILQQIKTMYEKVKKIDEKLSKKYSEIGNSEGGRTIEKDFGIIAWFTGIQYCELVIEEWRIKNIEDLLIHLIITYRSNREKLRKRKNDDGKKKKKAEKIN